jgi:hypothetical protein
MQFIEMLRKLLLTTLLAVLYAGRPPHLGGALLITFIFLLMLIKIKPYVDSGLNITQQISLVSQFLTVLGALMFLVVGYMDEVEGEAQSPFARSFASFCIVFVNVLAALLFPIYRYLSLYTLSYHPTE